MKSYKITFILCLFSLFSLAQNQRKQANWQQEVAYNIDVELNDVRHILEGNIHIKYTNNSPDELNVMIFHIWPNAYSDNTTDFARQELLNGNTDFYFADESERGNMTNLDFKIDDKSVTWAPVPGQPDICILKPITPIKPGQTVDISTPFTAKIPGSFSRFGHVDQDYQITQWYPKPAVYDVNGWNQMAYLNQGEFYSEFGSFKVTITLPENYLVAATGVLQEKSEWKAIRERRDNPIKVFTNTSSSTTTKTLTYLQDSIHDFAWFASKYFNVEESTVRLKNGHQVGTFVFAPKEKISATQYIEKALNFYSENCGYYPYKYCTVVEGPITAGGGMEYPMITVVTHLGEEVIVHEVGHNWFYGILGNNERTYPWMDESINSYFEQRTIHGSSKFTSSLNPPKIDLQSISDIALETLSLVADRSKLHQPLELNSKLYSSSNYGLMVYGKGSKAFGHLHAYIGEQAFYDCFRAYYVKWAFKHPLPDDMRAVFEEIAQTDLSWFFVDLLQSEESLDYRISGITASDILIENNGSIVAPYPVGFYKNGELQLEMWQEGHRGVSSISKPIGFDFDLVKIDPYVIMSEENRRNNTMRTRGAFRKTPPLKFSFLTGLENPNNSTIYTTPFLAWNQYNKLGIGTYFGNQALPQPNFRFSLAPVYSFETADVNGYGNISYRWFNNAKLNKVELGATAARFAYMPFELYSYNRISPYLKLNFRNEDKRLSDRTSLTMRYISTSFDPQFDQDASLQVLVMDTASHNRRTFTENAPDQFIDVVLERKDNKALNPFGFRLNLQYGMTSDAIHRYDTLLSALRSDDATDDFIKVNLAINKRISYSLKNKGLDIRIFIGTYLKEPISGLYQYRMGSQSGRYDYTFDQTVMGRNAEDGVFKQQVLNTDMYIKEVGNFGNIPGWTAAANLKSNLPGKIPISLYLDIFTFKDIEVTANNNDGEKFGYSGGLSVDIIPKVFEIYVPLIGSGFMAETQKFQHIEKFGQRITFMLNLNGLSKFSVDEHLHKGL